MPDAKSLLPGRAFRSEHAQLRPEPHSIASHGPAPMDPLQTTRMRNGVLYAAEWPCCHDPLRLSLGSEDPYHTQTSRARRAPVRPPRARGCASVRAPAPRARRGRARAALARRVVVALRGTRARSMFLPWTQVCALCMRRPGTAPGWDTSIWAAARCGSACVP